MSRRRGRSGVVQGGFGLVGSLVVVIGSVQAGLAVPSTHPLPDVAAAATLDYSALPATVSPLSAAFIAQALGREPAPVAGPSTGDVRPVAAPSSEPTPAVAAPTSPAAPSPAVDGGGVVAHPPANDDFARAFPVAQVPFTASTDASAAGRERGEPGACAPVGGTLWYRFTATETRGLVADTAGSQQAVTLGVFRGATLQELELVGCHTDLGGHARVPVTAEAGETYVFQVAGPTGGGPLVFTLDLLGVTTQVAPAAQPTSARNPALPPGNMETAISADGRFVAFTSTRSDLVPDDSNGVRDAFVWDGLTGEVQRVSVASDGAQGHGKVGLGLDISDDGRIVGFWSHATDLVPGDTNGWPDAFVHDRLTGITERVSVSSDGGQGTLTQHPLDLAYDTTFEVGTDHGLGDVLRSVSLSADGRMVAFGTVLALAPEDQQRPPPYDQTDVYVRDRATGVTRLVGLLLDGRHPNDHTWFPAISGDGQVVSYRTTEDNLVHGDDDYTESNIYVHDLRTGTVEIVSVSADGAYSNDISYRSSLSYDGRVVAFASDASNLVPGDTNGLPDVFVHDRDSGLTERVSVSSAGEQQVASDDLEDRAGNNQPGASISHDGRFVAFDSLSPNLVPGDTRTDPPTYVAAGSDVFLRDRVRGTTTLVSVGPSGRQGNAPSFWPALAGHGRQVAFVSNADDLEGEPAQEAPAGSLRHQGVHVHAIGQVDR